MKRLCVFAHWDRDNIVDDYVIYYLKALKEVCSTIIFVSDTDGADVSKLDGIADYCLVKKHGEYDFGSYKRGFFFALENNIEFDELLFANDSCYGPLFSLKPIFDKMAKKKCDWWGLTRNRYGVCRGEKYESSPVAPHIQSYFLLFKLNVFTSPIFIDFMQSITKEDFKNNIIIKYEIGLSKLLDANSFKSSVYINSFKYKPNYLLTRWDILIRKYKFPLLKTSIVKNGFAITGEVRTWRSLLAKYTDYPIELINKNFERMQDLYPNIYETYNPYRKIRFWVLKDVPPKFRYMVVLFEKSLYFILNTICFNKLHKF